jgi:hypothetical protein
MVFRKLLTVSGGGCVQLIVRAGSVHGLILSKRHAIVLKKL